MITAVLFLVAFGVYAMTISRAQTTTDVFGANWTSWHLVKTGSPWIDGITIPQIAHRPPGLSAIVTTDNGHTAFGRFPGVVVASLPAYLLAGSDSMTNVPASLTSAFLTAAALALMFSALRRHLDDRRALVATVIFGFATPVWTVSANSMWPHTITVIGIAGMAWTAASGRWWWTGVFGGITLWGRVHAAIIVAVLGIGVAVARRDPRLLLRVAVPSTAFLLASCAWIHWVYGSWSPLGAYDGGTVNANADQYRFSVVNQLGMWVSPDRGILVWTPLVVVLLPALVRSWSTLPDWSRSLLVGGLVYTVLGGTLNTFTGGEGFYGYRYGVEMLACATPALALSQAGMGRVARALTGLVIGVQLFAFFLGAEQVATGLPQSDAWHRNAFVSALHELGASGWLMAVLAAVVGALAVRTLSGQAPMTVSIDRSCGTEVSPAAPLRE